MHFAFHLVLLIVLHLEDRRKNAPENHNYDIKTLNYKIPSQNYEIKVRIITYKPEIMITI